MGIGIIPSEDNRIPHKRLLEAIQAALAGAGAPPAVCKIESELMVEADLMEVPSHGVRMLPALLRGIREGHVSPSPNIKISRERAATCLVDGDHGPGRFVSMNAMQRALEKAREYGVGACMATRLTHWGRAHAYACHAAQAGMIGLCTTNAIPNMVAWGSLRPMLANNPLAIAVPRGAGQRPIVLDMAMSQAAVGKIGTYVREGWKAPADWGLDASGRPTDDPAAILSSNRVLPFGGHKGTGLSVILELLTGALCGGLLSFEIAQTDSTGLDLDSSKLFLALEVHAFVDHSIFAQRIEDFIGWLHSTAPGLKITLPGDRSWQMRDQNLKEGIPIHPQIAAQLREAGVVL